MAVSSIAAGAMIGGGAAPAHATPTDVKPAAAHGATAPENATEGGLDAVLARCARSPGLSARFVEERRIALLAVPLRAEGTLHFAPGRGLVRHTTKPSRESVLVTEKEVVVWDGQKTRRLALGGSKAVETFARAFSLLLAADRPALEKDFELTYDRDEGRGDAPGGFRLRLVPRGTDLKKLVAAIEIEGRGLDIALLRVREANGDVSTTTFSGVDPAHRYSDVELEQLFRVPPR